MHDQNRNNILRDIHRITALRNRIAEKAYEVDARQIADKIIDFERALLRRATP